VKEVSEAGPGDLSTDAADIAYAYKPSLVGVPLEFRLTSDAFEWRRGRTSSRMPYDRIRRIRLGFRPQTMQNHRFLAEVWTADGPKLQIASTSWKSLVEQERFDEGYRAFVTELCRRTGAAGGQTLFQAGSPVILYWLGVIVFVGASLALAGLVIRALQQAAWGGAAFIAGFLAFFLWQAGTFFRRNRPGVFRPDAVPDAVLPRRR
jgi:hypothetical protein